MQFNIHAFKLLSPSIWLNFIAISSLGLTSTLPLQAQSLFPKSSLIAQSQDASNLYEKANPAVVTIKNGLGHGSGFIVNQEGLIITNAHVVEGINRVVTLVLYDGREVSADVIGFDKTGTDLAALRVYTPLNLPALPLAPSNSIKVGQEVFAIGTPFTQTYHNTLTTGIISRLDPSAGLVQHSVNINSGNSGGPLLNRNGEIVGVNVSSDVQSLVYDGNGNPIGLTKSGISFAVSRDRLANFLQAIAQNQLSPVSLIDKTPTPEKPETLKTNGTPMKGKLEANDRLSSGYYGKFYPFQGKGSQTVSIKLKSEDFNAYVLLYEVVEGLEGLTYELIGQNDDQGPGDFNASLDVELPRDGQYLVLVSSADAGELGEYTLTAQLQSLQAYP